MQLILPTPQLKRTTHYPNFFPVLVNTFLDDCSEITKEKKISCSYFSLNLSSKHWVKIDVVIDVKHKTQACVTYFEGKLDTRRCGCFKAHRAVDAAASCVFPLVLQSGCL